MSTAADVVPGIVAMPVSHSNSSDHPQRPSSSKRRGPARLHQTTELSGRKFDAEMARAVLQVTGAYAFHVQFVGALLWDAVEWPIKITKADFDQHRLTILEALDQAFFEARLARTSSTERSLLRAMAASGESAQIHDVLKLTRLPNQTAQQLIARLRDNGLIYRPQRGLLAFTVPLFGDYLRRASRTASRGSV